MHTSLPAIDTTVSGQKAADHTHGGRGRRVRTKSLAISPDLDKLLEHEEKLRRMKTSPLLPGMTVPEVDSPESPMALGSSAEFPIVGLPPPPRRSFDTRRRMITPKAVAQAQMFPTDMPNQNSKLDSITAESNPYINPAPTAEEILKSRDSGSATPVPFAASQQSARGEEIPQNATTVPKTSSQRKTKKNLKTKQQRKLVMTAPEMRERVEADQGAWQRRPLISHGQRLSMSSEESLGSSSTRPVSSTHSPTRISISSTIYPPSSAESHTNTLFNEPPLDPSALRVSFMEIYSPANPQFNSDNSAAGLSTGHISPIQFARPDTPSEVDSFDLDLKNSQEQQPGSRNALPKPPIPTTPKPSFAHPSLRSKPSSPRDSPSRDSVHPKPATTNFLDLDERSDLIRKSRKLTRVFGETPNADAMVHQDTGRPPSRPGNGTRRKGHEKDDTTRSRRPTSATRRRHSMPLTPDAASFININTPTTDELSSSQRTSRRDKTRSGAHHEANSIRSTSPVSFMDLSDDRSISQASLSPSQSLFDALSVLSVDREEEDRRRKRERLAKLHRFLGSRVPAHLVLGIEEDSDATLPPAHGTPSPDSRKPWIKRRRSSSVVLNPSKWPDEDLGRLKADLDDREKAINVRRAQKMEKVFGVAPPLTLYHTRHNPTPSAPPSLKAVTPHTTMYPSFSPSVEVNTAFTFTTKTLKKKKDDRPGTSDSSTGLLASQWGAMSVAYDAVEQQPSSVQVKNKEKNTNRHSLLYNHYEHSLNSLNDILDRDDRESLAELHEYLNSETPSDLPRHSPRDDADGASTPTPTRVAPNRKLSNASSIKSERRRSLPARTSRLSIDSEYGLTDVPHIPGRQDQEDGSTFQQRRRRAAKLTQFFGVDYRELINDVLESIETGVQSDRNNGTLREEEVEDLLAKLRNLKNKRQKFA